MPKLSMRLPAKRQSNYWRIPNNGSGTVYYGGGTISGAQTITTDLTAGTINKVLVDGKVIDSSNYTISGSNVILTEAFIKTLSNGKHTVTIENDTLSAKATITVNNGVAKSTKVDSSKTGDVGILLYAGMAIASIMGTGIVIGKRKEF